MTPADTSSPIDLRISTLYRRQNGQDECAQRCAERHQQRRKGRQTTGPHQTELEGYREVLERHAKTR